MAKFSKLAKREQRKAKEARYELYDVFEGLKHTPVLIGVYAGESNEEYYNRLLQRNTKGSAKKRLQKSMTVRELQEGRALDRKLYPKFVLIGWEGVVDDDGNEVPYTASDCYDLMCAISDEEFDEIRDFFQNPGSFVEDDDDDFEGFEEEDAVELGNSSPPGFGGTPGTPETGGQ